MYYTGRRLAEMKFLDEIKVIKDRDEYTQHNILQKWWDYC